MSRRLAVRRHINQRMGGAEPSSSLATPRAAVGAEVAGANIEAGGAAEVGGRGKGGLLPRPRGGPMKPVHPSAEFRVRTRPSPRKTVHVDSFAGGSTVSMQPLGVDTLRPLVDLAYWSTFVEVRRDCAAAFATLSMNDANLDVLSQAGAHKG